MKDLKPAGDTIPSLISNGFTGVINTDEWPGLPNEFDGVTMGEFTGP